MSLRTAYDTWHQRIYDADPSHEDASSPWYQLVREYIGDVAGLHVLEVACGRGGFVRQSARAGALVTGCDFSSGALRAASNKLLADHVPIVVHLHAGQSSAKYWTCDFTAEYVRINASYRT